MRLLVLMVLLSLLGACLPLTTYYREGAELNRLLADETSCEVDALAKAPVANEVRRAPPRYIPARRYCDAKGKCHERGGYWIPGELYTVDVNAPLRRKVELQCMAVKGYAPVEIPACPPGIKKAAPPGKSSVLPRLTAESCAIRNDDGSFLIVTRG